MQQGFTTLAITSLSFLVFALSGCSEHDCDLKDKKEQWNEIAKTTKGADMCFLTTSGGLMESYGNLAVSHYGTTVDPVAEQYNTRFEELGWETKLESYESKRANGKPLTGKQVIARKGDESVIARVYELGEGIINVDITTKAELDKATTLQ